MTERQVQLLRLIVEYVVEQGEPVGSQFLVEQSGLDLSGATVRNEMRELEEAGLLTHPHTSAGRVPTEAGYRYYAQHCAPSITPKKKTVDEISAICSAIGDRRERIKGCAKYTSQLLGSAVIVSFDRDSLYYTGISALFSQPEFRDYAVAVRISTIFDQCEDRIDALFDLVAPDTTTTLIGKENPLGSACSIVARRFSKKELFAVVGPMRMQYGQAQGLLDYMYSVV